MGAILPRKGNRGKKIRSKTKERPFNSSPLRGYSGRRGLFFFLPKYSLALTLEGRGGSAYGKKCVAEALTLSRDESRRNGLSRCSDVSTYQGWPTMCTALTRIGKLNSSPSTSERSAAGWICRKRLNVMPLQSTINTTPRCCTT